MEKTKYLSLLAKIKLKKEETSKLEEEIEKIIEYFNTLREKYEYREKEEMVCREREDIPEKSDIELKDLTSHFENGFFIVPPMVK